MIYPILAQINNLHLIGYPKPPRALNLLFSFEQKIVEHKIISPLGRRRSYMVRCFITQENMNAFLRQAGKFSSFNQHRTI